MPAGQTKTILKLVQEVLSALSLTDISTLGESDEDVAVLAILNREYNNLITEFPWACRRAFVNLEVTATANVMRVPDTVVNFDLIRYNNKVVSYIHPLEMDKKLLSRDTSLATVDADGAINDHAPTYWTTVDDEHIIFDSYDASLQSSLSRIYAQTVPTVEFTQDTEVTDLPQRLNSLFFNMIMEWATEEINGDAQASQKYMIEVRRLRQRAKRWAERHYQEISTIDGADYARRRLHGARRPIETSNIIEG